VVNIFFNHFIKPNPVLTVLQLGETSGVGQLAAGFKSSHGLGIGGAGGINARITYSTSHGGLELGYIAVGAIADGDALRLDNGLQILVAEGAQAAELLQIVVLVHPQEAAVLGLVDGTGLGLRILALVALAGVATQAILGQSLDIAGVTYSWLPPFSWHNKETHNLIPDSCWEIEICSPKIAIKIGDPMKRQLSVAKKVAKDHLICF